jgi:two-component system, response regulator PdtaR
VQVEGAGPMNARVLIVEDEYLIAMEMQFAIEDLGHAVVGIAPDSATAYSLAEDGIDVALVDIHLRDGVTGAEIGRHLAGHYGAGVVFVTANPRKLGDGVEGTVGVLNKPAAPHAVADVVEYVLSRGRGDDWPRVPPGLTVFRPDPLTSLSG